VSRTVRQRRDGVGAAAAAVAVLVRGGAAPAGELHGHGSAGGEQFWRGNGDGFRGIPVGESQGGGRARQGSGQVGACESK